MRLKLLAIFAFGLALRFGLIAMWHTDDLSRFETGDYILYEAGAQHIREEADLQIACFFLGLCSTRIVVSVLGMNRWVVLLANTLAGALLIPATCLLARRLNLSQNAALLAALVVAIDPGSVVYSAFLGPEPMANLLFVLSMTALFTALQRSDNARYIVGGLAGGLLAASALIRPATYLLWLVVAGWLLLQYRHQWRVLVLYAAACAIPIAGWVVHNGQVFNNYTFSTVAGYTMLYYRAASVEYQATEQDIDTVFLELTRRVEAARGNDPALTDENTRWGYHAASPEITAAINQVSMEVFTAHPLIYLATIPVGFARMYGLVPQVSAFEGVLAFAEAAWNVVFTGGAMLGVVLAFRNKAWTLFWCILLVCAYFTGGTLLVKTAGMDTRERSMLAPFMACAFVYLLLHVQSYRKQVR